MADSKNMVIKIVSDAKDFVKGMEDALRQIQSASQKAQSFDKIAEDAANLKEELLNITKNLQSTESAIKSNSNITDAQIKSMLDNFENLNKKFDSFRHTFGDMQEKVNGLSTRTLQAQLDKANASLDAFNQKYSSLQQTLNMGLGAKLNDYKDINKITNIREMEAAYKDALKILKNFSEESKKDGNNYSKAFIDAAAAVYKYSSALMFLNDIYYDHNNKKEYFSKDDFEKIQNTAFDAEDIIGDKLADKINENIQIGLKNINIENYFKEIEGQVNSQTLTGAFKNGGIIIPVKLDPKAYATLESEINKDISTLQSKANANPIKINYKTDTEELSKNINKFFKELNTKLKNQVTELNTLMKGLVDDTGLKKTEQDFSSMAKLIPEMLRKVVEYSEQLKTITTDTKNSFENVNNFVKEENFINYANAIKETADSFKLLTSSLDDISSKLSGNGLEGQFDLLKKKFSEISVDSFLNKEDSKEINAEKKAKLKEIRELFALYSTYQSRGGIRPFSDLISGESNVDKKAYLQLAYNDYTKDQKKKGNVTEPAPFDAKQLKDILQILKDIKQTIKSISEIKIDTSELAKILTETQSNNINEIFTPQTVAQIWQVLIQYANNYSESLERVIANLEIISKKEFEPLKVNSEELEKAYNQINTIIELLKKGFNIPSLEQLDSSFDNIKNKYNSLLNDKGALDLRKNKQELKELYDLYNKYLNLGGEKDFSFLTSDKKNQQKISSGYKKYLEDLDNEKKKIQEDPLKEIETSEKTKQAIIDSINEIRNAISNLRDDLNLLAEIIVDIGSSGNNIDYTEKFDKIRQSIEDILDVEFSDNSLDYRGHFDNIQKEIVDLNEKAKSLNDTLLSLDFDKINNIEIPTEPFDRIVESLKEIIDLTEKISGVPSKSSLNSQFKNIQKIYSSLINDKGNFIVTKDKDAVHNLFSQYNKYQKFGGTKTLTDLDESKANTNKLFKYYDKYLNDISQQKESDTSTTNSLKNEVESFIGIKNAADEATASKESFVKANKKLETQTDKTSKSLEQEKAQFETFINDVKTLVTTDIKTNNVVDFNTQILDSTKLVNDALKEELQQLQQLNEIQKSSPIGQNKKINDNNNSTSRNTSSKKQNNNSQTDVSNSFKDEFKDEFDYEDLGLSYDPYLNAFQEFLLLAAEEAEKVKQQIISVAEFDNRLSEALAALYGQIPDLDDISASTGYGKNFNVTGATVSFRDKATNDIYRKTFSLKKDKETGNFYIDQTTAILNDAEKYGKDNEKQAQKVLEWQTKLNAWLQSFSNKTSGTLDSTKDFQSLKNFNFSSEKDWINIKTIQQRLEGLYNEIVLNSTKGTSSLRPVPNMMYGQESRQTKKEKVESIYNKMAIKWNGENGAEDTESELKELSNLYNVLQIEIQKFNEDGANIESVAKAYGDFNEQLNKVTEQLNRMKIVNTEINGNKINNLNNWFKDMPNPENAQGKIERYSQIYNQFVEAQQRLNGLTTNLTKGNDEISAQKYEETKESIHNTILELEELKKILSSDSMNINNQMGQVIKQNLPETTDLDQLKKIIDEYADAKGKIQDSSQTGLITDKEGNQFIKFSRIIQDTKGVVSEFEFTYDKAMGTVAVATKKIQEPESAFKALADELTTKWRGLFTTLASFVGFYRLWGYFKQGIVTVREFDSALTEMQKVSDETISTLQEYQKTTFDTADAIGATALQIQNSTADFMRLGESLKEAAESAKVANILMNVSEFQSIDEATKSLIAMSAAYDDLSKMNIIDKLNEVGNNYAISTSEAATALQNSASALKTAGNDMDEALALITAGNAVVQDANKVGTGMRTIALRLTGTKSAKEELEEIGEETDNVIVSQSKLRDTIKQATAVASNGFKGFDILDDNGNYKSTYEIMLGIAEVYNEILETDKQLGRNNANLLLESVAGKTRANIAASIFQNPELLKEAYKSSQEAENSAMEENEKYMNSINGHIAQLQNAYQQLWANSINRDTVNYFIDLGKAILKVVDDVGLLGTAFVTITGVKSIVGYQNGKGFAYELIKGSKKVIENLAKQEGALGSLASTAVSAGQAIKGAFSSAIPIIGGVATAVGLVAVGINAFIQHQKRMRKELIDSANTMGNDWKEQRTSLSDYASQYEELKKKLTSENLSEQETLEIKQQIYDIQKQITEQYGHNADGIDLINGKLQDQLDLINSISQAEASRIWESEKYQQGFELAKKAMTTEEDYSLNMNLDPYNYKTIEDKELSYIIQKYTQERKYGRDSGAIGNYRVISGNPKDADERVLEMIDQIEKLQAQYSDNEDFKNRAERILSDLRTTRDKIEDIRKDNESTYLEGLPIELMATKGTSGYKIYSDYQSSVSNLEDAYISGDTKKIEEARKALEEATIAKDKFLNIPSNNQFSLLFDNIDTSLIKTKNQIYDATEAVKKAKEINTELDRINNYKEQKKQANAFYNSLGNVQKVGNIDNGNRPIIFWDNKELKKQQKAIESWGETIEDFQGSMSTVYGGSGNFDGVEIAFTPIINDGTGKGKLLNKETLYKYIDTLIGNAGEGWTNESLLKLDTEGLVVDGQKISNVLGAVGNSMSNVGLTTVQVGELMHDWQSGSLGYISEFKNEWQEAIEQGESLEEHMRNRERDLLDTSKATDKYTKKEIKLAKALREVTRLDMDRVDAEMVFDENAKSSEAYSNALYNLMDALGWASDAHASFIDWAVDVGLIQGTVTDALDAASVSYNDYAQAVSTATENLALLQTVLTESDSGKGLSTTTLDQFKTAFGDDAVLALEKTANGIRVNRDAIRELGAQQDESLRTTQLQALNDQYTALQKVYEGYEDALHNGDPTTPFIQQEEAIKNEINNLELLQAEWRGTTSAYQAWLNAQSNSNPQDMYANVISGYETVEDLIARGWWTDESVRNYLDLVLADDFDAQIAGANELKEGFESLDKTIQGTSFSIHDFFMTDESGNIVVDGLNNFEDALKQVQEKYYPDKNWLTYEDGNAIFDFRNGGNKEVADALGIGTELLDIIISAMESAGGFEVKLDTDDAKENLKQLKEEAIDAKESLDLNEKINLDPSNIKEADESINNINTVIEEIKNNDEIDLEAKTDQLEEANKILEYLIENKNQLIQSSFGEEGIHLIDIGELDAVNNKLKEILNRPVKGGFDFSEFDFDTVEGLTAAQDAINNMVATPNVDDSQIQYLNELLDVITEKLGIINGIGSGASLTLGEYKALDETVTSVKQQIQEGQDAAANGFHISWSSDEDFYNTLDAINNLDPEIKTAFGLIPDKTTEELMDMVENGETIFVETKTTGVTPAPVQDETRTINTQENITLGVTTVGADTARSLIQEFEEKNGTESTMTLNATSNVSETKQEIEETQQASNELGESQPDVTATLNDKATSPLLALGNLADSIDGKSATIWSFYKDPNDAQGKIKYIAEHVYDRKQTITTEYKTTGSPPKGGTGTINGTAHAQGTAFARGSIVSGNAFTSGKWGILQNQTALTGELGTEIVVRDGNWFTVGEDGAEFVDLQKGDIVFNHKQAQELLENGYVTSNKGRGKLVGFANGSAFYRGTMLSGPAYGDTAKRTRTTSSVTTKKVGKKNTKKTTTGKGNGGGGGGSGNGGGGNGGTTNKEANKTKNTLDEVEILIARIERQIANLDKTISSTYKTWSTRNNAIKSDLAKVSKEIKEQNKAYTTYMKKANSIQIATAKNSDGSTKSAKDRQKQSATWKKRIQNGEQIIRDVNNQDIWDKIQEYKQWYEKALAAKDAVIDLKEKEGELYKQRFDNEQTYYEELIGNLEHAGNLLESYNDKLSESGKLGSQLLIRNQIANEKENIRLLNKEYDALIARRNEAVNSGKIKKYSEAWYEMTAAIQEVSESIAEAQNNVITLGNNIRQLDWDRWDKIHDAIGGVNNELEFLYDLFNSDDFFDEQGNLTDQGVAGFALLAQQYDTYFRQAQEYQKEIEATEEALKKDPNNQELVDKLKELKEAQQDAVSGAKDTKEAMVDLTEDGIKKQIDYVKDLIEDYEDLLETQKDQIDYAKKIADQQKELNKLEKQYRAIQNDTSEEGAAKRQKLRDQINEKRDELQESQDDRRLSETKDMLSDFEESFEQFLEDKLKDVEGIVRQVIDRTNANGTIINDAITALANSYGYTPSDTLKNALTDLSTNLVSYFNGAFDNENVRTIASGVDEIVRYYKEAQNKSEEKAGTLLQEQMKQKVKETGTHMQTYTDINGNTRTGFFNDDGTQDTKHSGWVTKDGKQYLFTNGTIEKKNQWYTGANGKKYYLDQNGARATGVRTVDGKTYFFGSDGARVADKKGWVTSGNNKYYFNKGTAYTGWKTINKKKYYFNENGAAYKGLKTIKGKNYYFDSNGIMYTGWRTISNKRYYFGADGAAYTGWKTIDKQRYYFDANGAAYKGLKTIGNKKYYFDSNGVLLKGTWRKISNKQYYLDKKDGHVLTGKQTIDGKKYTFNSDGTLKKPGWKKGTASVPKTGMAWTNEGYKAEAIIRKSDGAILTPLNKGDSVIPSNAMKNMYQALTDPEKYLKQYTTPDVRIIQGNGSTNNQSPTINMQFIANGVQDPNKFVNELMNNKKLEKWIQEVTLGQANGHNSFRKYSYAIR